MLRLDRNDPLDRMILQELEGNPVLLDTFLDAMDELEEEPDYEEILRERGLRAEEVLAEAEAYRTDFRTRMAAWRLPMNNRFELCSALLTQAKKNPAPGLLHIYCEILCDPGFLMDTKPEFVDNEAQSGYEEYIIGQYLTFCLERDELLKTMMLRKELAEEFSEATKQNRNPPVADCDTERKYEIGKCFSALFEISRKGNRDILLDNLSNYMQVAAASPTLKSIEPLFLFRLLTKHQSRMYTTPDLNINVSSLWKRDNQQTSQNNGRNFKQFVRYLHLFVNLCRIYQKDASVDLPLCWYGLDQISVLGDFYREHISTGWEYVDSKNEFQWIPVVEELVEDALFSCFENGLEDNVLFMESGLKPRELDKFRESSYPPLYAALEKISDYMNACIVDLAIQSSKSRPKEIRVLCRDILEQSKIKYKPKSPHEVGLFLAAINGALMECQDSLANYLLTQAGHALIGEPTEISEWPE